MHDTLFMVLETKHNLSIFEPEIKNPLSMSMLGKMSMLIKKTCILNILSSHSNKTSIYGINRPTDKVIMGPMVSGCSTCPLVEGKGG